MRGVTSDHQPNLATRTNAGTGTAPASDRAEHSYSTTVGVATMRKIPTQECELTMEKYLLIPLDETVVFPGMTVTMPLDAAGEARVLLVPRHEGTYAKVGTVAEVVETGHLPGGGHVATLSGKARAQLRAAET